MVHPFILPSYCRKFGVLLYKEVSSDDDINPNGVGEDTQGEEQYEF